MKPLFLCLIVAGLPVFGGQPVSVAPLAVFTSFEQQPPRAVVDAVQMEVKNIMQRTGLPIEWRSMGGPERSAPAVELAVVNFRGRCDLAGFAPAQVNSGALGWTHVSNGVILPFSEVDCAKVRGFLQHALVGVPRDLREQAYGRALGRVLAHELYHVLAGSRHGSDGIAKPAYTVAELMADEFVFEDREVQTLRSSKSYEALENAGDMH